MIAGADEQLRSDLMLDVADEEAEEPNLYYEPLDDVSGLSLEYVILVYMNWIAGIPLVVI